MCIFSFVVKEKIFSSEIILFHSLFLKDDFTRYANLLSNFLPALQRCLCIVLWLHLLFLRSWPSVYLSSLEGDFYFYWLFLGSEFHLWCSAVLIQCLPNPCITVVAECSGYWHFQWRPPRGPAQKSFLSLSSDGTRTSFHCLISSSWSHCNVFCFVQQTPYRYKGSHPQPYYCQLHFCPVSESQKLRPQCHWWSSWWDRPHASRGGEVSRHPTRCFQFSPSLAPSKLPPFMKHCGGC